MIIAQAISQPKHEEMLTDICICASTVRNVLDVEIVCPRNASIPQTGVSMTHVIR